MVRRWLLSVVVLLGACASTPDADVIRARVEAMAASAASQDRAGVLAPVADDFTGNGGELDRDGLDRLLRARLLAGRAIGVSIGRVQVERDGDRATARFDATLTDGSGRWLPDHRATLAMVTGWRREGREWRCYSAQWTSDAR